MRSCDDGYPSCRAAEGGGEWCKSECLAPRGALPKQHLVLRARRAFKGARFSVAAGEMRFLSWRTLTDPDFVPRIAQEVRNGEAIDWGGAAVQSGDYEVVFDGPSPLPREFMTPNV
jgi:hypothetical protein